MSKILVRNNAQRMPSRSLTSRLLRHSIALKFLTANACGIASAPITPSLYGGSPKGEYNSQSLEEHTDQWEDAVSMSVRLRYPHKSASLLRTLN